MNVDRVKTNVKKIVLLAKCSYICPMEKKNVGKLFDSIAGTYDRFNHLLSLNTDKRWRRRAVKHLVHVGSLLDVATGTADLAMEIVHQCKAEAVTGMDISTGMMEIGKAKVARAGLMDKISFLEGSALDMPFDDGAFAAVTCAYGVRNFSNLDRGLQEMNRVLCDGGQLMILEFSYPSNAFVCALYDFFFTNIMPLVGKMLSKNAGAYTYFRDSVKGFIWGQEMVDRIASAGFRNVTFKTMTFGITTVYYAEK